MLNRTFSIISFLVLLCPDISNAASIDNWHRDTALSPDGSTILFTHRGDIFRVASTGGIAIPLTSAPSTQGKPVWSPDGKWIAYTNDRHGNLDVFVMPAQGGQSKRLTFHESDDVVSGFSADSRRVVFNSARYDALDAWPELWVSYFITRELYGVFRGRVQCHK